MSLDVFRYLADSGGSLSERPPVPGEETEDRGSTSSAKSGKTNNSCGTPRRSNLTKDVPAASADSKDEAVSAPLGFEPEGSASTTPPYTRWTESLHALLSDEDGIQLFKHYLLQENAENPLLFWLAAEGFKKKEDNDPRRTELAKLIYRRFIKKDGQMSVRLESLTRNQVAESIRTNSITSKLFDASQREVEEYMRETSYPMFLKSDIYVQYVNNGGVSPKSSGGCSSVASGHHVQGGYLPTLPEDSELADLPQPSALTSDMLMKSVHHRYMDRYEERLYPGMVGVQNPYHPGCAAIAPATSNNDSELQSLSSDAISDDTMSLTDSSVDGFPVRSRQHQKRRQKRNMKYNIRQNGKVMGHLPIPRAQHPREIPPTDPAEFARILTEKLEKVLAEREAKDRLAAKLRKVEEDEMEVTDIPTSSSKRPPGTQIFPVHDFVEDDPNSILEDHMSRVFDNSPRPQSPDHHRTKIPPSMSNVPQVTMKQLLTSHQRHHAMSKSKEHMPPSVVTSGHSENSYVSYSSSKKRSSKKSDISSKLSTTTDSGIFDGTPSLPSDTENSTRRVAAWLKGDDIVDPRMQTHTHSSSSSHHRSDKRLHSHKMMHPTESYTMTMPSMSKKPVIYNVSRPATMERTYTPTTNLPKHSSPHLPKQPFVQDPKMPIMQPPETNTVLAEASRRIELQKNWSSRQQRSGKSSDPRKEKRAPTMSMTSSGQTRTTIPMSMSDNQIYSDLARSAATSGKRPGSSSSSNKGRPSSSATEKAQPPSITIAYYLCHDPIPYRTTLPGSEITLRQFKALISKKGSYRYTFKMPSTEFESGVVHQIVVDDDAVLPLYQGKVVGKVEPIDEH